MFEGKKSQDLGPPTATEFPAPPLWATGRLCGISCTLEAISSGSYLSCDFLGCDFLGCDFLGCDFLGCEVPAWRSVGEIHRCPEPTTMQKFAWRRLAKRHAAGTR